MSTRDTVVGAPSGGGRAEAARAPRGARLLGILWGDAVLWISLAAVLAGATFLRLFDIGAVGYNSDEAVYAGQGAAIAGDPALEPYFPIFRAHPLLFQSIVSIGYHLGQGELFGRILAAVLGVATVFLVYRAGSLLYGRKAGLYAALFLALMPYHVLVTRQVLLDGPMVFLATLTLYLIARYATSGRVGWLYAAGAGMGLTFLTKETSVLLLGALYAFFSLAPQVGARVRHYLGALAVMALVIAPFPLSLMIAGRTETGQNYLAWQLFRRPNHGWDFYASVVPEAIGFVVIVVALAGLWLLRRERSWRETLLLCWIVVPVAFFELWPVKGFQYLLPVAPAVAILAGRTLGRLPQSGPSRRADGARVFLSESRLQWLRGGTALAGIAVAVTLLVPTWQRIQPATAGTFLAGSGGVPGGRETGHWIDRNVPKGAVMLTIGPSMANLVQFYGHRKAYGLSVSPNPLHRNPAYEPVPNPDLMIRSNELQYIVWDSYSADRSSFFSRNLLRYADRYHGRVVYTYSLPAKTKDGKTTTTPAIVLYEVRP